MIYFVIGTRPEIIKLYPTIMLVEKEGIPYKLIWSGQHYDYEMSRIFFEELQIPEPDIYLNIDPEKDITEKLGQIIASLNNVIKNERPNAIYALGDTTTTLAAAIVAAYNNIPFIHDEAGMRSNDRTMLEEINRIIADRVSTVYFAPTKIAVANLIREGITSNIFLTGSTAVDAVLSIKQNGLISAGERRLLQEIYLPESRTIITVTLHRRENLAQEKLLNLIKLFYISQYKMPEITYVFPIHPHTKNIMIKYNLYEKLIKLSNVILTKPLGYLEFLALMNKSDIVITDSGGVQVEAYTLGKKVITMRSTTEWYETVIMNYNTLVQLENNPEIILKIIRERIGDKTHEVPLYLSPLGDGQASLRITKLLIYLYKNKFQYNFYNCLNIYQFSNKEINRLNLNDILINWYDIDNVCYRNILNCSK
ncbi:UDP-N-acetylglucosamine 2-epimerase [Pyrobaculum oguniense TE7]|uniref:UDP-N-acetylglucosamine 2-epimerase n=1 Tax=Pyrobaculum oguniense (strain DSM 13380 / JCM 10595 / TE7) TaxID=698757 RepID=H6QB88_PYROT|nr:UDP-N-acetylglucosamine 2-epimerase [Pyrobaculum oguniense TE7]